MAAQHGETVLSGQQTPCRLGGGTVVGAVPREGWVHGRDEPIQGWTGRQRLGVGESTGHAVGEQVRGQLEASRGDAGKGEADRLLGVESTLVNLSAAAHSGGLRCGGGDAQ